LFFKCSATFENLVTSGLCARNTHEWCTYASLNVMAIESKETVSAEEA